MGADVKLVALGDEDEHIGLGKVGEQGTCLGEPA